MTMKQGEKKKLILVFGAIVLLACYVDLTSKPTIESGYLERANAGEDAKQIRLQVDIGTVVEDYVLEMELESVELSLQEVKAMFEEAKREIDEDFMEVGSKLPIKDSYVSEMVDAVWSLSPEVYVQKDGKLVLNDFPEEGVLLEVSAHLTCGEYEEQYTFPIFVNRTQIPEREIILAELEHQIEEQIKDAKEKTIHLPQTVHGETVTWSEEKEYLVLKILFLEVLAYVAIEIAEKRKKDEEEKRRRQEIELSYSEIVGQLTILLQAGMTIRQAWNRIALQIEAKTGDGVAVGPVSDAILHLSQRLKDGEKERVAYERLAMELDVVCYRRLVRLLIGNLEKGTGDLAGYLEQESQKAYEERVLLAKKLGEEASTKMLVPLMLMMVLVMVIVMAPAVVRFSI